MFEEVKNQLVKAEEEAMMYEDEYLLDEIKKMSIKLVFLENYYNCMYEP